MVELDTFLISINLALEEFEGSAISVKINFN